VKVVPNDTFTFGAERINGLCLACHSISIYGCTDIDISNVLSNIERLKLTTVNC